MTFTMGRLLLQIGLVLYHPMLKSPGPRYCYKSKNFTEIKGKLTKEKKNTFLYVEDK